MSCYQSASATMERGTTGPLLVIKVKVHAGFVPASIKKGEPPFEPENVFPVTVYRTVPSSDMPEELEVRQNVESEDEFDFVEIFCDGIEQGTRIKISKK